MTVRLEVITRMYKVLMKLGVGTGVVKAEAAKIVREKTCGPTGHPLLREAITEEKQLFCGHLPQGGGGLTNSVPFGVILVCVWKLLTY